MRKSILAPFFLKHGVCYPMLTRDKRSLEFTVTREFMKLFRTGSATV